MRSWNFIEEKENLLKSFSADILHTELDRAVSGHHGHGADAVLAAPGVWGESLAGRDRTARPDRVPADSD